LARWEVTPTAARSAPLHLARDSDWAMALRAAAHRASASCSTRPGALEVDLTGVEARPFSSPPGVKTPALMAVVPTSMDRISSGIGKQHPRVHDPVRIERGLDLAQQRHALGTKLPREVGPPHPADAVVVGQAAA